MIRVDPPPPSLGQLRLPLYEWDIKDFFCAWSVNIPAVDYVSVLFCVTRPQREDTVARIGDTKMGWLVCLPTDHTDDLPFSSAQFKDHLGAPPSDATVIEPTDRAHETFQARSRCRTRARFSLTLVFLPPSPLDRTGWCIDSIHARRVVILVFGHPLDSIDKTSLFFFMGVREDTARGHCLSFYDKLNFLFRTRQTKARDSCFFFFKYSLRWM